MIHFGRSVLGSWLTLLLSGSFRLIFDRGGVPLADIFNINIITLSHPDLPFICADRASFGAVVMVCVN